MAGKEANMVLLDMGCSMQGKFGAQPAQNRMDVAVNCIKLMIQQKMFNSKTHEVGLILFGLEEEGQNIIYIRGLGRPDTEFLKNIIELKKYESKDTVGGDIFEALEQTIETINDYVGTKKIEKKIFLMTAGCGETSFSAPQVLELAQLARKSDVKLNVIAFEFLQRYSPENENEEEEIEKLAKDDRNQNATQNKNQKFLGVLKREIKEKMQIFPANVAISLYEKFRSRQVNARSKFSGELQLAKNLSIQIQLYTKTTEEKLPGLKPYSLAVDFDSDIASGKIERDIGMCIAEDPNMEPIDKTKMIKAYHYGRQLIPVSDVLGKQMQYESAREMKLLGFADKNLVKRESFCSGADVLIANQNNAVAKKGLAALAHAAIQLNKYAIIRYVWRNNGTPKLCALIPQVGKDHECFYMIQIPTSESVRDFQFNALKESTQEQQAAAANLIDKMDLMKTGPDHDEEALEMKYTFNPTRQYFYQTVFHRVFNQGEEIPPLDPNIKDYITPEKELLKQAKNELKTVKEAFQLEVVEEDEEEKKNKKVFWRQLLNDADAKDQSLKIELRQDPNVISEDNQAVIVAEAEEAALIQKKFAFDDKAKDDIIRKVSSVSPVEDFFSMLQNKKEDLVNHAIQEMQELIHTLVETSIRGSFFDKALKCLKALRRGCTSEFEKLEAPKFNKFLYSLKDRFLKSKDNCTFWKLIIQQGISLITNAESKESYITAQEAVKFLQEEEEEVKDIPIVRPANNDFDIMDELE